MITDYRGTYARPLRGGKALGRVVLPAQDKGLLNKLGGTQVRRC